MTWIGTRMMPPPMPCMKFVHTSGHMPTSAVQFDISQLENARHSRPNTIGARGSMRPVMRPPMTIATNNPMPRGACSRPIMSIG